MSTIVIENGYYRFASTGYVRHPMHRQDKSKTWLLMQLLFWLGSVFMFGENNWKNKDITDVVVSAVLWFVAFILIARFMWWLL